MDSVGQGKQPMTWDTERAQHSEKGKFMLSTHAKGSYEDGDKAVLCSKSEVGASTSEAVRFVSGNASK